MELFKNVFGKIILLSDRLRFYLTYVQFFMIMYLSFQAGLDIWLLILGIPIFICLIIFDWFIVYPQNMNVATRKNPYMENIRVTLERIEKEVTKNE